MKKSPATTRKPSSNRPAKPSQKKVETKPQPLVACTDCGQCCTYVAIEIESPTTAKNATQMLFYLYHERTSLYCDSDGEWVVQFETRCRNLGKDNRCGVYEVRPHICREFDETYCEVNTGDDGQTFRTAAEFLEHLRIHRPKVHAKVAAGYALPEDLAPRKGPRRKLPIAPAFMPLS